jgi:hypothetical protein
MTATGGLWRAAMRRVWVRRDEACSARVTGAPSASSGGPTIESNRCWTMCIEKFVVS